MQLESLFAGSVFIIYMIVLLYIFIYNDLLLKQKIIICYIFCYLLKISSILSICYILIGYLLVSFVYFEFLSFDDLKNRLLISFKDKLMDYLFVIFFQYEFFLFLISLLLTSTKIHIFLIDWLSYIVWLISLRFLYLCIIKVNSSWFELNSFTNIKSKITDIKGISIYHNSSTLSQYYHLLCHFEDKSYFSRPYNYNLLCCDYIKYKYKHSIFGSDNVDKSKSDKWTDRLQHQIRNFYYYIQVTKRILKCIICKVLPNAFNKLRGYSTLEMQLIRTLGLKNGYKYKWKRKFYEIFYSNLFFKNLRKYYEDLYVEVSLYKEYLLYIYFNVAPVKINGKKYKNIMTLWNKNKVEDCDLEEIFIGILGLSHKKISEEILYEYHDVIQKYNMDSKKLHRKIQKCIIF